MYAVPKQLVFSVAGALASGVVLFAGKWIADQRDAARFAEQWRQLDNTVQEIRADVKEASKMREALMLHNTELATKLDALSHRMEKVEAASTSVRRRVTREVE